MKKIIYLLLVLIFLSTSLLAKNRKISYVEKIVSSCRDYSKPQSIHKNHHFYDGNIHFAPIFKLNGKKQRGYVVLFVKPKSIYEKIKLRLGDVVTHVGDTPVNQKISISGEHLSKIKNSKFTKLEIERCNKIKISKRKVYL